VSTAGLRLSATTVGSTGVERETTAGAAFPSTGLEVETNGRPEDGRQPT
jgi:hypothetical protein